MPENIMYLVNGLGQAQLHSFMIAAGGAAVLILFAIAAGVDLRLFLQLL